MMISRNWMFLLFAAVLTVPVSQAIAARDGSCFVVDARGTPTGSPYNYTLNLNGATIPAQDNKAGTEVRDLATISSGSTYDVSCNCTSGIAALYTNVYYTATSPLAVDKTVGSYTYYRLNDNLSIATSMHVLGRGNIPVPFESEPNIIANGTYCNSSPTESRNNGSIAQLDTGSSIVLSFYVNKPFVGRVSVPATVVADLYGGINATTSVASTTKLAEIRIVGDIVAPQSCEITDGQNILVDFGPIPRSEFSSTAGTAITSHKVTKQVQVQCTGMLDENIVYSTFNGDPVDANGTMLRVPGNDDVGITIYDKWDKVVNVNGGKMDMDMGVNNGGAEKNSLTFSAAPASATGATPAPGTFEAYATITLEITN